MASGSSDDTDVLVIDTLTVVTSRQADGSYRSEVIDLPGCVARAATREEVVEETRKAIDSFLGK
jgi:predicted RNase H-like HicB family nuclease